MWNFLREAERWTFTWSIRFKRGAKKKANKRHPSIFYRWVTHDAPSFYLKQKSFFFWKKDEKLGEPCSASNDVWKLDAFSPAEKWYLASQVFGLEKAQCLKITLNSLILLYFKFSRQIFKKHPNTNFTDFSVRFFWLEIEMRLFWLIFKQM